MDLFFEPNGYTLLGMHAGATHAFDATARIRENLLTISAT
jgi:hypothetical protein